MENMENDPKMMGFNKVDPVPPSEPAGDSLGMFLPNDSIHSLNKLTEEEHRFLQSLLERLSDDLQALQTAQNEEDLDRMMATVGFELASAMKLKSLEPNEAYELVINMVSAVAASGVRCLFLNLLHNAIQPKGAGNEFIHRETVDNAAGAPAVET